VSPIEGSIEGGPLPGGAAGVENAEIDRLVMKPTARRRLGKYVLLGRVGHGGMGKIYLAYAPGPAGIEKLLVVKRLHSHLTSDPVLVNSFLDEARLSMALNHPNIVHTYDVGDVDGRYFMVMEYIEGQNLGVLLRTAKRSSAYPSSALWAGLFLSVLDGLHAAHTARDARGRPLHIIHRDVSPQNILVGYEGLPKLVDFGIAKAAMRVSETDAGVLKGKYAYMSPEQVRGEPLDARSDVFAAGIVLWEMLAGRRLYKADSVVRSVERILTELPISPVRVNADCDPELAKVAFKALQKERQHRFASALEMKDALDDALRASAARVRQSDVRELMHRLFGDVIERQRAVLESCLAQNDGEAAGVDDDDVLSRHASDSESDLSLNALARARDDRSEVTTPAALRGSPLVTAEGEPHDARPPMVHAPAGPAPPPRPPPQPPGRTPPAPLLDADALVAPGGEITRTRPGPPERSPRARAAAAGVVAIAAAITAIIAAFALWPRAAPGEGALQAEPAPGAGAQPTEPMASATARAAEPPEATMPAAGAAPELPAGDIDVADAEPARPPEDAAEERDPTAPSGGKRRLVARRGVERPEPQPQRGERAERAERTSDRRAEGTSAARPDRGAEKGGAGERVEGRGAIAGEEAAEGGTLSLDTVPWTVVYLGKKRLGETPLVSLPVPAGTLELLLVNPEAGVKESYVATVKAGQEYRARLDLQ
jgi:eukaryotic-like serine/threonine-protein kinase